MRAMGPTYVYLLGLYEAERDRVAMVKERLPEEVWGTAVQEMEDGVDHLWAALNCWSCFGEE